MEMKRLPDMMPIIKCYSFRLLASFIKKHHSSLLDIGVGEGEKVHYWHHKGLLVQGCDHQQSYLDTLQEQRFPMKYVELNDTTTPLPYDDNSFDVVTLVQTLEHVEDPKWVMDEAKRIAKYLVLVNSPVGRSYYHVSHLHFWHTEEEVVEALLEEDDRFYYETVISKVEDVRETVKNRLNPELDNTLFWNLGFILAVYV
jgi:ubiquinone/menaquinone biosynthesis C-methylase UbiE